MLATARLARHPALLSEAGHSCYATPEYDGYYRRGEARNVVTVDGHAVPPSNHLSKHTAHLDFGS
ncbi:hypothetical protein [Novosphingobium sp. BL-52-GroH]|uniref:hypothetical protein n=1 Tax=Novosphingobium sp. BL-52-GroH TaxID=3349877 RepID=UPI0038503B66